MTHISPDSRTPRKTLAIGKTVLPLPRDLRVLVIGAGPAGVGAAEAAAKLGAHVTLVARSVNPKPELERLLLAPGGIQYQSLDVYSQDPRQQVRFRKLAHQNDLVINAAESVVTSTDPTELVRADAAHRRFYGVLEEAGFTVAQNQKRRTKGLPAKRVVRVGSPPAEIPRDLVENGRFSRFDEDSFTTHELVGKPASDPLWDNPYFRGKVQAASLAKEEASRGLDLVTAAPTDVISWYADHGTNLEPTARLGQNAPPMMPAIPTDAVPADIAGRGMVLAGLFGEAGQTYQLAGAHTDTYTLVDEPMRAAGRAAPRRVNLSLAEARHYATLPVRPQNYAGRFATNLTRFWMGDMRAVSDGIQGWKDYFTDVGYKMWPIEPYQLALNAEMGPRNSDKVRALNNQLAGTPYASLEYPSGEQVDLGGALQKQAAWLSQEGLLPGAPVYGVDLTFHKKKSD